ncbi:MAG TPA: arylamine N-acetyltransferase, partial [Thermoanaerobaculia bacterium]|nr:arylamine N-acetyltransferase [Thermoanaerobaculia bacterium]
MSEALDLDAYFERIGIESRGAANLATLSEIHEAHVRAVPFENLDVALSRPIAIDLASVFAKIVLSRRGGYCFEQNTLFRAVLEAVGFTAELLEARVRRAADVSAPRTHALVLVSLPEGPYVADVGFGAGGLLRPLPLSEGALEEQDGLSCGIVMRGERWVYAMKEPGAAADGFCPRYDFTLERPLPIDLTMANHFTSTHP